MPRLDEIIEATDAADKLTLSNFSHAALHIRTIHMAKAKPAKRAAKTMPRSPTIAALRTKIDRIDRELVAAHESSAAEAGASDRQGEGSQRPAAYDPVRECEVLERVTPAQSRAAGESVLAGGVSRAHQRLASAAKSTLRVAHLGPAYTYSHLAAIQRFGQSVEYVPVGSIGAVFEEVNRGHCDYGLVPIENTTDGRIADTLDMFTRLPVQICGEVNLRIHHCLLGKCPRERSARGLQQAAGAVAVPQLAEPAFAAGAHHRSHQHLDGRATGQR